MKKILLILALSVGFSIAGFCQTTTTNGGGSLGFESGLVVGTAAKSYKYVVGGSLKFAIPVSGKSAFTATFSYSSFMSETDIYKPTIGYLSFKGGFKYNFINNFYGEGQVGVAMDTGSSNASAFVYSPGVGYDFAGKADIGLRYEAWSTNNKLSQVSLRLAFGF